jgi:hypothetical protein
MLSLSMFTKFIALPAAGLAIAGGTAGLLTATATSTAPTAPADLVASERGTVKGKVLNVDGEPAEGIQIRFFALGTTQGGSGAGGARGMSADVEGLVNKPVRAAKTDARGEFTINNFPVGSYIYRIGQRRGGDGFAQGSARVQAGKETVLDIKLRPSRPGRGGNNDGDRGPRRRR